VFQCRLACPDLARRKPRSLHGGFDRAAAALDIRHHDIQAVAEALYVRYVAALLTFLCEALLDLAQPIRAELQPFHVQTLAQLSRNAGLVNLPQMHESDPMTPLRLIQVWSSDDDGQAIGGQVRECVPELAPRDR